jgi:hypothetical protein
MKIIPLSLKSANAYVMANHRHHKSVVGHKFSVGLKSDGELVGVAICGRPVARHSDNGLTLEVARLCTNGIPNGCSKLYGAAARIAKEMGYDKVQTYILDIESGTSLKASGWIMESKTQGGDWVRSDGSERNNDHPLNKKQRWVKYL